MIKQQPGGAYTMPTRPAPAFGGNRTGGGRMPGSGQQQYVQGAGPQQGGMHLDPALGSGLRAQLGLAPLTRFPARGAGSPGMIPGNAPQGGSPFDGQMQPVGGSPFEPPPFQQGPSGWVGGGAFRHGPGTGPTLGLMPQGAGPVNPGSGYRPYLEQQGLLHPQAPFNPPMFQQGGQQGSPFAPTMNPVIRRPMR